MSRYTGFSYEDALVVLDSHTGEVVRIPLDGGPEQVLRAGRLLETQATPASAEQAAQPARLGSGSLTPLDHEVLGGFPYPIAISYRGFLEERDPLLRCRRLVDTFTGVLKLWALQVASEYLRADGLRDPWVNETLLRDFQRPLTSAWNLMLQRCLPVFEREGLPLFSPELGVAYSTLETKCRDKFLSTKRVYDASGETRVRRSKLGKIQALIKYRNSLAHGYNLSRERAQADLDDYEPLLRDLLQAARFMRNYPLFHVPAEERRGGTVHGYRLMGAEPPSQPEALPQLDLDPSLSPLFLLNESSGETLPLYLFFELQESDQERETLPGIGKQMLLFEGRTKNAVIYVSTGGEKLDSTPRIKHWRDLLADKHLEVKLLTPDSLTLETLRAAAWRVSSRGLHTLESSGKYLRDVALPRSRLQQSFTQLADGDYRGLVLAGESGSGKTTALAQFAENRHAAGDVVVFYRAANLPDLDLTRRLTSDLGLRDSYLEDFIDHVGGLFMDGAEVRSRFWLIVDAVNEHPSDPGGLARNLDSLVSMVEGAPWFRIVPSVRTAAYRRWPVEDRFGRQGGRYLWQEDRRGARVLRTPLLSLGPLEQEELGAAYEAYRAYRQPDPDDPEDAGVYLFRPLTPFKDLDPRGRTRALLRQPLLLRLILSAFNLQRLPSDLSYARLFEAFLHQVVEERDGPSGISFPERRRLLRQLVKTMSKRQLTAILRDELSVDPALKGFMRSVERDSPYVQLVELGVLLEEWHEDECWVRFAFEHLFEYLLCDLCEPEIESGDDLLALAKRAVAYKSLRGALVMLLGRSCAKGRSELVLELLDSADTDAEAAEVVVEAGRELLVYLARGRSPYYGDLLQHLADTPSVTDLRVLLEVFDSLLAWEDVDAARRAAEAALTEARRLEPPHPELEAGALVRLADVERLRGEVEGALAHLSKARELAEQAGDEPLALRVDVLRARIQAVRGDADEALLLYERASAGLYAHDQRGEAAKARVRQAEILGRRGDLEAEEALALEALEWARDAEDTSCQVRCWDQLGMVALLGGDSEAARENFMRSLELSERMGNKAEQVYAMNHLGDLARASGDVTEALRRYTRGLEIREALGYQAGVAYCLIRLGGLGVETGTHSQAKLQLERALKIARALGERSLTAHALECLSDLSRQAGQLEQASALLDEALGIRREVREKGALADALDRLGMLGEAQGHEPAAREAREQAAALRAEVRATCRLSAERAVSDGSTAP